MSTHTYLHSKSAYNSKKPHGVALQNIKFFISIAVTNKNAILFCVATELYVRNAYFYNIGNVYKHETQIQMINSYIHAFFSLFSLSVKY